MQRNYALWWGAFKSQCYDGQRMVVDGWQLTSYHEKTEEITCLTHDGLGPEYIMHLCCS